MKKIIVMVLAVFMCATYVDARGSSSSSSSRSSGSRSYSSKSSSSSRSYNSSSKSAPSRTVSTPSKSFSTTSRSSSTPSFTPRSTPAPLTMPKYNSSASKITPKYTPSKSSSSRWFNRSTPRVSTSRMVPTYHRSYSYNRPYYNNHYHSGFGMTDYLMLYMIFGNHNNTPTTIYQPYPVAPTPLTITSNVVTSVPAYLCNTQYLAKVDASDETVKTENYNGTYTVDADTARKVENSKNSVMLFNVGMIVLGVLGVIGVIGLIVYNKMKG